VLNTSIIVLLTILNVLLIYKLRSLTSPGSEASDDSTKEPPNYKLIYSDLVKSNRIYNIPHNIVDESIEEDNSVEVVNESLSIVEVAE
jgi:anionic cell wall polymer biosynthesis LytR-Cps2A-Psr (LCP) family protein